jgi:Arc/MetJ-type ribon-helix-helix transcriptional regulator
MLNISLPNQIIDFIERQSIANNFSTPSDYILYLILQEQERIVQKERVKSLLIEGLDNGAATDITDDFWSQKLREQLKEGAIIRAERDLALAQEWFDLDEVHLLDTSTPSTKELIALAQSGKSFDFLDNEADLYNRQDGEPIT